MTTWSYASYQEVQIRKLEKAIWEVV